MAINDLLQAVMVCEGAEEATEEFQLECWQYLVDTGAVHVLQGWFGRTAAALIQAGLINKPNGGVPE
jgi:hypothetical protein